MTTKTKTAKKTTKATTNQAAKPVGTKTTPKNAAKAKATHKADAKKMSQIDAALAVLAKSGEPMNCKAMVEAMAKKGLWTSPGGATPDATLLRDLKNGKTARFAKVERSQFTLAGK